MFDPPHPGEMLREDFLAYLGLSVTRAAALLGVSRVALSRVVNGKAAISPDLAVRLEKAGAGKARLWLAMQASHDLYQARHHGHSNVQPFPAATA